MKKFFIIFSLVFCINPARGEFLTEETFITATEILTTQTNDAECAPTVFANALASNVAAVSENDTEQVIQQWIYEIFEDETTLQKVLECPEIVNIPEEDIIKFSPIQFVFPNGREIIINYETQPKILKQKLLISKKRNTPTSDPNPKIGSLEDTSVWVNTDPAWYAIMVVEAGSLDDFVGPEKNNTISIKWINDNIDKIYPKGYFCTSKSALANDHDNINVAMHEVVNLEEQDTNDYYVAGDANLSWIGYAEIALDVTITIATAGGGAVIAGVTKAARASKILKTLNASLKTLRNSKEVVTFIQTSGKVSKISKEIQNIDKLTDTFKQIQTMEESLRKTSNSKILKELNTLKTNYSSEIAKLGKKAEDFKSVKDFDDLKSIKNTELKTAQDALKEIEKTENVKKYKEQSKTFSEINQYRGKLKGIKIPQRGNMIARTWRAFKAANSGGQTLKGASKIARSSIKSGKIRDWLYHTTLKNIAILARLEENAGFLYGAISFIGNTMYDFTETSTGEFTNNIDFKPLTLLSADDIQGQENVINYGMWLMWLGDSISPEDDDAAFLQAMDFANKFHFSLEQLQETTNSHACNVDIYVVRPIIRNPGTENAELYYLIMNDEPWTTEK